LTLVIRYQPAARARPAGRATAEQSIEARWLCRAALRRSRFLDHECRGRLRLAEPHCFDHALLALRTGRVRTDGIITDVVALPEFEPALAAVASQQA
jgi:hypothetical protein